VYLTAVLLLPNKIMGMQPVRDSKLDVSEIGRIIRFFTSQSVDRARREKACPAAQFKWLVSKSVRKFMISFVLGDWRGTLDSDWLCPVNVVYECTSDNNKVQRQYHDTVSVPSLCSAQLEGMMSESAHLLIKIPSGTTLNHTFLRYETAIWLDIWTLLGANFGTLLCTGIPLGQKDGMADTTSINFANECAQTRTKTVSIP
jgi:hypothetical protein